MIITISGTPGSGKSTVGKILAKKLRYRYLSIGGMRRAMAKERGLTLQEFNVLGEKHAYTDVEIDRWQTKLGRRQDNLVVEGRTSFHFIPHSVKIFLAVSLREAARRIFHDRAHVRRFEASHHYQTPRQLEHGLRGRMISDTKRYLKYYKLNIFQKSHYDLWLDTTKKTPAQTITLVLSYLAKSIRGSQRIRKKLQLELKSKINTSYGAKIKQKKTKVNKRGITPKYSTPQVRKLRKKNIIKKANLSHKIKN